MAVALAVGSLVAADRSSSAMASAATKFLGSLDAGAAAAGELRLQLRRADALALHPDRDVPAKGTHDQRENESQRKLAHDLLKAA